jgi:hypothetical protein
LQSTYFQSPGVRQRALGFCDGRPQYRKPTRFMSFALWWRALLTRQDRSLAGLLRYRYLVRELTHSLARERLVLLPLEWVREAPDQYLSTLLNLGLPREACQRFIAEPPLNRGADKRLNRERPWMGWAAQTMSMCGLFGICRFCCRATGCEGLINRVIYGGEASSCPRGFGSVREEIGDYYCDHRVPRLADRQTRP